MKKSIDLVSLKRNCGSFYLMINFEIESIAQHSFFLIWNIAWQHDSVVWFGFYASEFVAFHLYWHQENQVILV